MEEEKKSHGFYQFGSSTIRLIGPQLKTPEEEAALLKEIDDAARMIIKKMRQAEEGNKPNLPGPI